MSDKNKSWWNKLLGLTTIYKLFIILFLISTILQSNSCFASKKHKALFSETIIKNERIKNSNQGYFKSLKTSFIIDGNPIKLNDGRILITGNRYSGNLIFDPETNKFSKISKPTNSLIIYKGCLLNNGKVLFVGAITKYPITRFPNILNKVFDDIEKNEISSTVLNRPFGVSTPEYRHKQYKEAMKKYIALTETEREKLSIPYFEKEPNLLNEFNEYKNEYANSMYGQIYNPDEDTWSLTGKINIRRNCQQSILLNDEKALIIDGLAARRLDLPNGIDDKSLAERTSKIEIYNPVSGNFELKQNTKVFGMWMLLDMKIMKNNEIFMLFRNGSYMHYNPITDTYSDVKKLPCVVKKHIFLQDGRLLLFTGINRSALSETNITGISIFDINTEEYKEVGNLAENRGGNIDFMFTPVELSNGNILILGGQKNIEKIKKVGDIVEATNSAEIFNIETGVSKKISNMNKPRINTKAIMLDDGRVLMFDRKNGAELYIPNDK